MLIEGVQQPTWPDIGHGGGTVGQLWQQGVTTQFPQNDRGIQYTYTEAQLLEKMKELVVQSQYGSVAGMNGWAGVLDVTPVF